MIRKECINPLFSPYLIFRERMHGYIYSNNCDYETAFRLGQQKNYKIDMFITISINNWEFFLNNRERKFRFEVEGYFVCSLLSQGYLPIVEGSITLFPDDYEKTDGKNIVFFRYKFKIQSGDGRFYEFCGVKTGRSIFSLWRDTTNLEIDIRSDQEFVSYKGKMKINFFEYSPDQIFGIKTNPKYSFLKRQIIKIKWISWFYCKILAMYTKLYF